MDMRPLRKAAIRERIPLRSPHHMKTIPIPAATNVASAAMIVPTEIWAVSAEITLDQSDAVTTVVSRHPQQKPGQPAPRKPRPVATGRQPYFFTVSLTSHAKTSYNIFYIKPKEQADNTSERE